ncbi:phenylalanine--tRNA ligase subunit beta [Scleromatobacter humisilvae]|uniref:Phenylalanine--tRNA ligase beta subunit n=1 Tax=Scleromatobacter humisilvae TaxID=2897159 RepID=A0A9X2C0I2_9BURK|nr:phenylalanine--tRNA ligase subunit beta [Scleromatobacter humisilvae]MCK9687362.1 phenylalanine--tRNA ligase subunit beta [Scleromatobacter humisilvae]
MQFPESWLREFCNPPISTDQLAELLTMAGLEVEEMQPVAPPFSGIVVAEILEAVQHPNADKLRVCKVDAGAASPGGPLQIVCGAPNARVGIRVPLAMVGAELPPGEDGKPFKIGVGKLRGVDSFGMLCSARELKLSEDHGGLLELPAGTPLGISIRDALKLDDTLFTLKLTPNLAHNLSVLGIAREVSALTGAPLNMPVFTPVKPTHDDNVPVRIEATDLCGRWAGRVVHGVDPKATTPAWIVDRLARCGQRSVSPLVDISNYVMFELGRPSHIFDHAKIHDELVIRWAKPGETLKLLNGNTVELDEKVGVVADSAGPESLAGIMGGDASAVSDDTTSVYVEAAFWWPAAVAGRSRRFNFSTDAGHRFERGVDAETIPAHVERITQLILDICGGRAGPLNDVVAKLPERKPVTLRVARAAKVIGMPVTQEECAGVMKRLGLACTEGEGTITVTPPSWRFDLQIEEDLIEEVIRVLGFGRLPDTPPVAPVTARVRLESSRSTHAVRRAVAALDYQETINFSFVEARWEHELAGNPDPIKVLNPIAAPLAVMRSGLVGSLVQILRNNLARKAPRVRIFEIGRVFSRDASVASTLTSVAGVSQPLRVGGLAWGPVDQLQWGEAERNVDFFDVKGDVEQLLAPRAVRFVAAEHPAMHPGRCAAAIVDGQAIGHVGEFHPRWRQAYELPTAPIVFELDLAAVQARDVPQAQALPRQQAARRDLALVVKEDVRHDVLMAALRDDATGLVRSATLFDVYRPKADAADFAAGERSLAVRLELLSDDATLTDEIIDAAVAAAIARATAACGARLRA